MNGLLSVIVPVYNVEKYLVECLESIINQSYGNMEIILVDDGATDSSGAICDRYGLIDDRISVIHKTNGGLSDARNAGLGVATGKYIAFVDSDDVLNTNMYTEMITILEKSSASVVVCGYDKFTDSPNYENVDKKIFSIREYFSLDALIELFAKEEEAAVKTTVAWNKVWIRECFDNIQFPVGRIYEDAFTIHKLFNNAKTVIFYDKPLYYYRIRINSITNSNFVKCIDGYYATYDMAQYCAGKVSDAIWKGICCMLINSCMFACYGLEKNNNKNRQETIDNMIAEISKFVDTNDLSVKNKIKWLVFKMLKERYIHLCEKLNIYYCLSYRT